MKDELKPGLDFVLKNNLTNKEVEVYLQLLYGEQTPEEVSNALGQNRKANSHIVTKLVNKGLVDRIPQENKKFLKYKIKE